MIAVGEMPVDWLADSTRWQRKPRTLSGTEQLRQQTLKEHLPHQFKGLKAAEERAIHRFVLGLGEAA